MWRPPIPKKEPGFTGLSRSIVAVISRAAPIIAAAVVPIASAIGIARRIIPRPVAVSITGTVGSVSPGGERASGDTETDARSAVTPETPSFCRSCDRHRA
jgi:hypothetical protein